MLNIIYTELLKLKRSKVLLLIPIGGIMPPLLNFCVIMNRKNVISSWSNNFELTTILANLAMAVALFALLAGYIFSREYTENTINTLFTYSISRVKFILAKLVVMYILITVVIVISFVMTIFFGMLQPHNVLEASTLSAYSKVFFIMTITHLALVPMSAFLGMAGRSVIPPVTLGITAVFVNLVVASSDKYIKYFPWSIPGMLSFIRVKPEPSDCITGIYILIAAFLIGLAATIIYSLKSDILTKN